MVLPSHKRACSRLSLSLYLNSSIIILLLLLLLISHFPLSSKSLNHFPSSPSYPQTHKTQMNLLTRLGLVATRSFMISPVSKRPRLGVSSITPPLYNSLFSYSFSTTTTPTTQDSEEPISRKKLLPQELLSNNVVMLTCDSSAKGGLCHVYLVGTCHVLTESSKEVEAVISYLKPELVFLELCWNRRGYLTRQNLNLKAALQLALGPSRAD